MYARRFRLGLIAGTAIATGLTTHAAAAAGHACRQDLAEGRAEGSGHAGAHHAHAPEQECDASEETGEQLGAGHLRPKTPSRAESTARLT